VGMAIYFLYGRKHSVLRRAGEGSGKPAMPDLRKA